MPAALHGRRLIPRRRGYWRRWPGISRKSFFCLSAARFPGSRRTGGLSMLCGTRLPYRVMPQHRIRRLLRPWNAALLSGSIRPPHRPRLGVVPNAVGATTQGHHLFLTAFGQRNTLGSTQNVHPVGLPHEGRKLAALSPRWASPSIMMGGEVRIPYRTPLPLTKTFSLLKTAFGISALSQGISNTRGGIVGLNSREIAVSRVHSLRTWRLGQYFSQA